MLIQSKFVIMKYNILCSRIFCFVRLRCNLSNTFYSKCGSPLASHFGSTVCNFRREIHYSSTKFSDDAVEAVEETEDLLSKNDMAEDYSGHFRNILYPDSNDPIISQLKSCDSITNLYTTVNECTQSLNSSHYCQVLLVLYDLLNAKNCLAHGMYLGSLPESICNELSQPLSSAVLDILDHVNNDVDRLTAEELIYCLLYSKRLGTDMRHPSVQTILMKINSFLSSSDTGSISIFAISRLTVTLDNQRELWMKLFLIKTIPFICSHLDKCHNVEEFKALTISMLSTAPYLREDLLKEYEALTDEFLRKGIIEKENRSVIVKAVLLLNHIYYYPPARRMTYKLLHMLHGHFNEMFPPHLSEVLKAVLQNKEPHDTVLALNNFIKTSSFSPQSDDSSMHLYVPLINVPLDAKGTQFMKEFIANSDNFVTLLSAQSHLTTAMSDICNIFWTKVAAMLPSAASEDSTTLARVCFRYMNFSHRMLSYQHRQFESVALSLVTEALVSGTSAMQPKMFSLLASFVLLVDPGRGAVSLSSDVSMRLLALIGQLDAQACLWVSRGIGERLRKSKEVHVLLQVDSALNQRTRELLQTSDPTSIRLFNTILRSCINRNQSIDSDLMQDVMNRCHTLDWNQLTSRSLRNLVYNFHFTRALIPAAVERMVDYCLCNGAYILADTVGKLLHMSYSLGYTPTHIEPLCALSADLTLRDKDMLNGLSLLQVALALSFFNCLPTFLIRGIFTVDFLERLDNEIKHCYSKDRYPQRVRQTLMELNRSVCLDLPQADVPWFHSKFCEEQKSLGQLEVVPKSLLFTDIYNTLLKLVGDSQYIGARTFSPYGYVIDLELNLDATLNPVKLKSGDCTHKIALLLYHGNSYSALDQRLSGFQQMKRRHLEILGYRVVGLSDSLWNSMYMSEPKVKLAYLHKLVWAS